MTREVDRHVGDMAGGVSRSPDISSTKDGVGGSRTGMGTVPIPQMKVHIPKYRDGESIHQLLLAYKRSMMTLKIPSEQWDSYLSSSLSGEALEVFSHEISDEQLRNFDDVVLTISCGIGQMPELTASEGWT